MEIRHLPSDQVRATLGTEAAWVRATDGFIAITDDGRPQGGPVSLGATEAAGSAVTTDHGIRQARTQWGTARTAAENEGPQGLTYHRRRITVLVDQPTLTTIEHGRPLLNFSELEPTAKDLILVDGEPMLPGEYTVLHGRSLRINAPRRKEAPVSSIDDPDTPDMIIQEAMAELANELAGAYMRAADAATTPEEEEEAVTKMHRAWKIKNDRTMSREQMRSTIAELSEEIDRLGR